MALAIPVETNRQTEDKVADRGLAVRPITGRPVGSILIIGDDLLLVRALDRLLRRAGYAVGTEARWTDDDGPQHRAPASKGVALTIVDLPDHHLLDTPGPLGSSVGRSNETCFLWIGTTPPAVESPWFLAKPFTTEEFLSRVETLLATQN